MKTAALVIPPLLACGAYLIAFIHLLRKGNQ